MRLSHTLGAWVGGWVLCSFLIAAAEILFPPRALLFREMPVWYLVTQVLGATIIGLLIGLIYATLYWLLVGRPHRTTHLFAWSCSLGLGLGVLFVGGWTGFLCAVRGHWPHGHTAAVVAESIAPYILGGCGVGWLQIRRGDKLQITPTR